MAGIKLLNKTELLEELLVAKVGDVIKFGQTQLEIRQQYSVKTPNKIKVKYLLADQRVPDSELWLTIDNLFKMIGSYSYESYTPKHDPKYQAWN